VPNTVRLAFVVSVAVSAGALSSSALLADNTDLGVVTCTLGDPGAATDTSVQSRSAICTFKPKSGAESSYTGLVRGGSRGDKPVSFMWRVETEKPLEIRPGVLERAFAADAAKAPQTQVQTLVGAGEPEIILQPMADPAVGAASATEKAPIAGAVVLGLELKLRAAAG